MNTITVKKTVTSILASICLLVCLIHAPDITHLDPGQFIRANALSKYCRKSGHYSTLLENNYVLSIKEKELSKNVFLMDFPLINSSHYLT